MSKQLPWLKQKITLLMNIETLELEDIPEEPGVYVMLSDHTEYIYPWSESIGNSKVYYIGRAKNLRERLGVHKRLCGKRLTDRDREYYWPRYEYAAHHGCNVGWIISKNPNELENELLRSFAEYYGAKPVANGQSAW
jgi:excinuclease UvrABC nuclease subunit